MAHRQNPYPTIPVTASECEELIQELHVYYLRVHVSLQLTRQSKTYVQIGWLVECCEPCSLLTEAAFSLGRVVEGNKMHNLSPTLYGLLWAAVDGVLADVEERTKIVVFPV